MFIYEKRCETLARYMIVNNATVRQAAAKFGISKSTVHKDVTEKLKQENKGLYSEIKQLLEKNRCERHLRGGAATKTKYELIRESKRTSEKRLQKIKKEDEMHTENSKW